MKRVIAIDLGASSGRVIAVTLDNGRMEFEEIYRFPNEGIYAGERFYTDVLYLFHEIVTGLQMAYGQGGQIDAIGIDSWGVDFGLLDNQGELLGNPYHYRDGQSVGKMEQGKSCFGEKTLFYATGVQDVWYNTVYQILGLQERNPRLFRDADTFLMLPDVLGYFFTGTKSLEYTSVSTTQMYCLRKKAWSGKALEGLQLTEGLFPEVLMTGAVKGKLTKRMKGLIGIPQDSELPLIAVAQHDSASAAYAVPAGNEPHMFINSGTWSIIGMIMDEPVITDKVYERYFSNEGAAYGKVKLVKTIMGMWLIQDLRKGWKKRNLNSDYDFLTGESHRAEPFSHMIDVDDRLFIAPEDMEAAINQYLRSTGQPEIREQGVFYRTVMESLAFKYRESVLEMEEITGQSISTLYLLGGAVQDHSFCQFIANATGKVVSAGPVEATAAGNALIQLKTLGAISDERENVRILRESFPIHLYQPRETKIWDQMYEKYRKITQ